ncbi:Ig-like domain-containing protein [Erwinia sorbitola]|uniref:Ig-like domain-containing protein n=1 Tax=Erwinia sorbitola TaxID=2681984 RepID=A0A6I6EKS2_9GAMM|nr:Ig-like domain-containing protein [Erwinia sorbitola]QGU86886.1 Ig-like domain-containing protein [Erwinia sorbitola]
MAQLNDGRVDIISRDDGKILSQANAGSSRSVLLNQPSIVKIHGTREMVGEYERQGNDLILHMKDGTTVRYQQFFFDDVDGDHSELVFDDGDKPAEHVLFPLTNEFADAQTAMVVTPQYESLGSLEPLLLADTGAGNGVITAAGLGALGLVGVGAAAFGGGGGGGGGGDDGDNDGGTTTPPATRPTLTIGAFAGDNTLTAAEKETSQLLSGSTTNVQAGQTVTIVLNGVTYTATVQANGSWSVSVPSGALEALANGSATITASVSNSAGQGASDSHSFTVQSSTIAVTSPVSGDGYLSAGEAEGPLTLSGSTVGVAAGTAVSVTLGGHSYSGITLADGSWTVTVPSADLQQLPQGSNLIVASITPVNGDRIENSTSVTVNVITTQPTVAIDLPFGDGVLSGQEAGQPQTITGRTGVSGPGQTVSIDFNNNTYTGTVNNDGSWSVTLPANAVTGQLDTTLPLKVNITDPAGNSGTSTIQVTVATQAPVVSNINYDSTLNASEVNQPLTVTGNSAGGKSVTVTLDGQSYTATVNENGSWSVNIPSSALQQLGQGEHDLTVTSTDKYGNVSAPATAELNVDTQPPVVTLSAVTGDNYVSPGELATLEINGTAPSGSIIRVTIGDRELSLTATANGNNEWSILLSPEDKAALADGSYPITVSVTDAAGNEGTAFGNVTLAVEPGSQPSISLNTFAGDNILQGAELAVNQELSGTTLNVQPGQALVVTFNGVEYPTTVLAGGLWHVIIPASALENLPDGQPVSYSVTVSNAAGIPAQPVTGSVDVINDPLAVTLAIAPVSDDNWINATEAQSAVTVSGSSQNLPLGTALTVTFNGKTYAATVDGDGNWSTQIPAADLAGVANGSYDLVVTDAGNTSITATLNVGLQADFPDNVIVNAAFGGDNILNGAEALSPQTITLTTGLALSDQNVSVELNGKSYTATFNSVNGTWSIIVPPQDLQDLPQGSNTLAVTVTDAAGNTLTHNASVSVDTVKPDLDVGPVAGDGIINRSEQGQPLALSGTAEANSTITVVLNGVTYRAGADGDGNWSVSIAPSTLQTLADGKYDISVTARDSGGNETTTQIPVTVDTSAPPVTVAPVSGDGYLNALEHNAPLAITGTTEPGSTVVVSVNNVNYTATVDANGNWSATVPASVVSGLADNTYTITATATDTIGNTGTSSQPLTVIAASGALPTVAVSAFAGDNILDGAEKGLSQLVTGTTTHVQAGQVVTVTLNGENYTGLVQSDGSWSVLVPASALYNLTNGTDNYLVSVSDVAGNPASTNGSFTVDNTFSAIAIGVISDDNMLNATEALQPLAIHGFSRFVAFGSRVTVSFNNKEYLTTTNSDGSWTVTVPPADLAGLRNGDLTVTASAVDVNGNTITVQHSLNSEVTPGFLPEVNTLFGDEYLNAAEAGSAQTISGSSGVEGAGQTVSVLIGGIVYTGTVDSQGNWSVSVPAATLQSLPQGSNTLTVTLGDGAGNSVKVDAGFTVDTAAPAVSLDEVATDNSINLAEQNEVQTISGSGGVGDRIFVTLNNVTYDTVVDGTGHWSIDLPVNALKALTTGSHDLQVTSIDAAQNSTTVVRTIDVDTTPPPVSVNPVSGGYINAAESHQPLTVSGTGEAGNLIRVELGTATITAVVGPDGSWSAVISGDALAAVTDGSYTLNVTATDPAGNTTTTSTPLEIDTGVPSVFIDNITANNSIDGAEQQVDQIIQGTATNVEPGQTLQITVNGQGATYTTTTTIQSGGGWQANLPASFLDGLANGSYTLTANVTDKAGNTGTTSKPFSVDDTQPAIAVSPISEDGYLNFNESQAAGGLDITLTTANIPGDSTVTFELGGKTYSAVMQQPGSWIVNIPRADVILLTNNTYTGVATVTGPDDQPVATNNASLIVHVTNLPEPTLNTPFADNVLDNTEASASQTLTGSTGESGNGQSVKVNIGGTDFDAVVNSSGAWTLTLTSDQLLALPGGSQTITVTATDVAGNSAASAPVAVNIATGLPPLTLEPIAVDGTINATEQQSPLVIEGTTAAGNTVVLTLDGKTYNAVVDSNGNWTATIPAADLALLDDGGYDLTVTATDPVGNKTVNTEAVVVDTAAPAYTLDPIGGDGIIDSVEAAQPLDISGTGTTGDSVSVTIGGTTLTTTVDGDGKWAVTVPVNTLGNLDQGQNPVSVVVTTPEGNTVTQNTAVIVNSAISDALLVNPVAGDDVVNALEAAAGLTITGSVPDGTTAVVVTFNNQSYTATVGSNGLWSANIPSSALAGLADTGYSLTVVATPQVGDSVTVTHPIVLDTTVPQFDIASISDGYLSAAEQGAPLGINGTGTTGDTVRVTLNNKVYLTTVDGDGNWTVNVPTGDLTALSNGNYSVSVVVKDPAGNTTTKTSQLTVDVNAPALTLDAVTGDNIINASEQQNGVAITGTGENGSSIVVTLNGKDYLTTVGVNGQWSVDVSSTDLAELTGSSYPISVTETDLAGNKSTQGSTLQVNTAQPTITINPFAGNDIVDGAEQHVSQKLTGTTTSVEEGQQITLTLNGVTYSGLVLASGAWSIDIPAAALEALSNGQQTYTVSVSNGANTLTEQNGSFEINNLLSGLAIDPIGGDGFINAQEAQQPLVISGTSANFNVGDPLTVTVGGVDFPVTVGASGEWTLTLQPGDITLADGPLVVSVSGNDAAGTPVTGTSSAEVHITNLPDVSVDAPFGDGFLNGQETGTAQTLTGTTGVNGDGQTVTVTLEGITYTGTVDGNGSWSVTIPSAALAALPQDSNSIQVVVNDAAGNPSALNVPFTVDTQAPAVTVAAISGDGMLNAGEQSDTLAITGTGEEGSSIAVTLNGVTYPSVLVTGGLWTVSIPSADLQNIADGSYQVSVTATDAAQNSTTVTSPLVVKAEAADLPTIAIDTFAGNNVIDGAEQQSNQLLSGTTTHVEQGQTVTVTIGTEAFYPVVQADGSWSVSIPSDTLTALQNGTSTIQVAVADAAGNPASSTLPITINNLASGISIDPISGGYLSADEAQQTLIVTGHTANVNPGTPLSVFINGQNFTVNVGSGGVWSVLVPASALAGLNDGKTIVTANTVDAAGNPVSSSSALNVVVHNVPQISIDTPFGDGALNASEAAQGQTLNGTSGVAGAGQTVSVTIGANSYTGTVDAGGNWSINLPADVLQALPQNSNSLAVTVTDAAGNSSSQTVNVTVDTAAPTITLNPIALDDVINATEAQSPVTISGGSTGAQDGQAVNVVFNGQNYSTTVDAQGNWTLAIPAAALNGIADGSYTLTATVTDAAGNPGTVSTNVSLSTASLQPTINTPFGDGYLSFDEAHDPNGQSITGTTGATGSGQTVVVTVGGVEYDITADINGNWTLSLPTAVLQDLGEGPLTITADATNAQGNSGSISSSATVDQIAPSLTLDKVAGDNVINGTEIKQTIAITGSTSAEEAGQQVTITFNGDQPVYTTIVQSDGTWRFDLPGSVTQNLSDDSYIVTATLTDKAGNQTTQTETVEVRAAAADLPLITINTVSGDDYLNTSELGQPLQLTGTTNANVADGQLVTITINGKTYTTGVEGQAWSIEIPAGDVANIQDGPQQVSVSVSDIYGNVANATHDFTVIARGDDLPSITINPVTSDDMVDYNESRNPNGVTITGSSQHIPAGETITVTVNQKEYTATVDANGNWTATIPQADAQNLPQNSNTITATGNDVAGNTANATDSFTVHSQPPLLEIDASLVSDGILSLADALTGLVLSGTTGPNLSVEIGIGTKLYSVVADENGEWSTAIPSADLLALVDGDLDISVSVKDAYGNTTTNIIDVNVDVHAVTELGLDTPFVDGLLNGAEAAAAQLITGTVENLPDGASLVVNVGTLTGLPVTLNGDGTWTATIPAGGLVAQGNGIIQVTVSTVDAVNPVSVSASAELVLTTTLNPVIATPFGDGLLDVAEAALGQTLTGTTGVIGAGQTITLTIDNQPFSATVDANGVWQATLTPQQLVDLGNNPNHVIKIVVGDEAGNTAENSLSFGAIVSGLPTVTIDPASLAGNGILTQNEVAAGITLTGAVTFSGAAANTHVIVNVNGTPIEATINGDGTWSLALPGSVLSTLPDGDWPVTVKVTDGVGNTGSADSSLIVAINELPAPTITTPFLDGLLNITEAGLDQVLSGTTKVTGAGQTVTVSIDGGADLVATVNANGDWSLNLSSAQLTALGGGEHTIKVTATDAYGNSALVDGSYDALLTLPLPTINNPFGTGLGITEAANTIVVTGTTGIPVVVGQDQSVQLKVDINGVIYNGVVQPNGDWSVTLPAGALNGLSNDTHQINVTVTDAAGNVATQELDFNAYLTLPQPTLSVPFDDGYFNIADLAGAVLSGTTGAVGAGQTVTVIFNGNIPVPAVVDANGNWTATITQGEIADFATTQGEHSIQVTVTDPGGNTNTLGETFIVDTVAPLISNLTFAGDNILDYAESLSTQTLSGTSSAADAGATVTLTIGARTLTGLVGTDGKWNINVGVTDLAALVAAGGAYTVSITDAAGNSNQATGNVTLNVNPTLDAYITLTAVNGDNIINATDPVTTTLSGALHNVPLTVGGVITITLNGTTLATIPVDELRLDNNFTSPALANSVFGQGSPNVVVTFTPDTGSAVSASSTLLVDTVAPTVNITQFAGDNILNVTEAAGSQTITGTASDIGSTVSVTLGTKTYTAVVQAGGTWTVNVPSADLQGLAQNVTSISATVKDAAGNTGSATLPVVVDTVAPLLDVDALLGNNVINLAQSAVTQVLTGRTDLADGQTVSVYLGNSSSALAQATVLGGAFSLALSPTAIGSLLQGGNVLTVRVQDEHGNQTSAAITVNKVFNSLLGLTVDSVFGDSGVAGYLNAAEAGLNQLITGTAVSAAGGLVSLTLLNGQILTANVGQDGKWSLLVPPAALATLNEGTNTLNLLVTDVAGNTAGAAASVNAIVANLPTVGALTNLFGTDNLINVLEAQAGQTIGGNLNAAVNSVVTVTLGAKSYTTTVQAGGAWSLNLPSADLLALASGGNVSLGVKVVDPAGNTASNTATIGVFTAQPVITLDTIFGDGVLNIADITNFASQLISGTVKNVAAGTVISLNIGGLVQAQATVDASGKFSTNLTLAQLQQLSGTSLTVTASVTDAAGNHAENTSGLQLSLTPPALTLNQPTLFGDGLLNAADALTTQLISGTTSAGSRVVVTVGNSTTPLVSATADANGLFSLALTPSILASLGDGSLSLKVTTTDPAGNTTNTALSATVGIHALPSVTLNPLFGDGVLSVAEALSSLGQVLSGHVNNVPTGTRVDIKLGALALQGSTDSSGNFNVTLTSAQLLALTTGSLTVSATVTDTVGNVASSSAGITIGVQVQPTVTVGTLFGDGILNAAELTTTQTISGTTTNAVAGSTVSFTVNGHLYSTTVGSNGSWSVSIAKSDLSALPDGTLTVTATLADPYGNTAQGSNSANVIAHITPTITIGTLFGNGALNAVEAQTAQTISGTTTNAEGSTIAVHIGTTTITTVVGADGSWSVSVPSAILKNLPDTTSSISADLVNGAGISGTVTVPVIVGTHTTPTVTLTSTAGFSDGYLNLAESGTAQTITGTSTNAAGGKVAVTIEGTTYNATIAANGSWSVTVPSAGLTSLADGVHNATIAVSDRAGNVASTNASFNAVTHNLPVIGVDPIASLLSVLLTGLTISGGTLRLPAGTTVNVTLTQSGQSQTSTGTVGTDGRYSAKFVGGLLSTLNLNSVVTVTAVDAAGNPASTVTTLLLGSLLPLGTASVMMAVASDESLAAASTDTSTSHTTTASTTEESSTTAAAHTATTADSTLVTGSDTSATDSVTTSAAVNTAAASETATAATDDGSYTIGGVTIALADGQTVHGESVTGSVGNDTITVNTMDFSHIDGGAGTDTLVLNGEHMVLDLTALGLKVEHVEIIDLGNSGNNSIKLDLNEALNITDKQTDDLLIKGTLGDQVTLANSDGGVWATTGQRTVDGNTFDVYHNSALSSDNTLGDVLIQHNLQVHVV